MTIGTETSTDTAQMIAPAGQAGVVALKPTVGRVSRTGVLPMAKSQDSPGPITQSVYDAALALQAMAGPDDSDAATAGAPAVGNYLTGLSATALNGRRVAYVNSTSAPFPSVLATLQGLGATTTAATYTAPTTPSIARTEFKRDLNAYLAGTTGSGAKSLGEIIAYNAAHADEGLKYQQGELTTADAVDLTNATTNATYTGNRDTGKAASATVIDNILNNGTPAVTTDDNDVVVVPSGSSLVNVADRAGYPVLTVPAGYGTGTEGGNPQSVVFIGGSYGEVRLLADGYAFEQATKVRKAPSVTNPSMFRCVPGSVFFTAEKCNPGDRASDFAFTPIDAPAADGPTPTDGGTTTTPATPTPAAPAAPASPAKPAAKKPTGRMSTRSVRIDRKGRFSFLVSCGRGTASCHLRVVVKRGSATLGTRTVVLKAGRSVRVYVRPNDATRRSLLRNGRVTVKVSFVGTSGTKAPKSVTLEVSAARAKTKAKSTR
jgi:hypothetical protein